MLLGCLVFMLPMGSSAVRYPVDDVMPLNDALVQTSSQVWKCCCRVEHGGSAECSGTTATNVQRFFYEAVTEGALRKGGTLTEADRRSQVCHTEALCCHSVEGSCQEPYSVWPFNTKNRYSIANVEPMLCTGMPAVADMFLTATPQQLFGEDAFLGSLKKGVNRLNLGSVPRDYTIIIDRSGSMSLRDMVKVPDKMAEMSGFDKGAPKKSLTRWEQVDMAVEFLAPWAVKEDPDGISVFFFGSTFTSYENIRTAQDVKNLFKTNSPSGGTYLSQPLSDAMEPDTLGRAETIFVITDGAAGDKSRVTDAIISYTYTLCRPEMLSISFIQVGADAGAGSFLKSLDDELEKKGARFDIVDAMAHGDMHGLDFLQIVEKSLYD